MPLRGVAVQTTSGDLHLQTCELQSLTEALEYAQGIKQLISALQSRGVAVYLISGGFRELTLPIARELGVHADNVFANRMNWQVGCKIHLDE